MWKKYFGFFLGTTCVSFTLIAVLFCVMCLLTDGAIGPAGPVEILLLFAMCALISVWTSWLRLREWKSTAAFYLTCYAGCVGVVLGLGAATGFIPIWEEGVGLLFVVVGMITVVFAGTAAYAYVKDKNDEARINAKLGDLQAERTRRNARD